MDANAKKSALRMIPYGLYVLMAESASGAVAASTVNWVTQTSFDPPLVAVAIKNGSQTQAIVKETGVFSLNMLGRDQQGAAFTFFKALERDGNSIGGQPFKLHGSGAPVMENCPAFVVLQTREIVERGDHHLFLAEVTDAGLNGDLPGRADAHILRMEDLGENVFYGG